MGSAVEVECGSPRSGSKSGACDNLAGIGPTSAELGATNFGRARSTHVARSELGIDQIWGDDGRVDPRQKVCPGEAQLGGRCRRIVPRGWPIRGEFVANCERGRILGHSGRRGGIDRVRRPSGVDPEVVPIVSPSAGVRIEDVHGFRDQSLVAEKIKSPQSGPNVARRFFPQEIYASIQSHREVARRLPQNRSASELPSTFRTPVVQFRQA